MSTRVTLFDRLKMPTSREMVYRFELSRGEGIENGVNKLKKAKMNLKINKTHLQMATH
jgi:hypothetical protein